MEDKYFLESTAGKYDNKYNIIETYDIEKENEVKFFQKYQIESSEIDENTISYKINNEEKKACVNNLELEIMEYVERDNNEFILKFDNAKKVKEILNKKEMIRNINEKLFEYIKISPENGNRIITSIDDYKKVLETDNYLEQKFNTENISSFLFLDIFNKEYSNTAETIIYYEIGNTIPFILLPLKLKFKIKNYNETELNLEFISEINEEKTTKNNIIQLMRKLENYKIYENYNFNFLIRGNYVIDLKKNKIKEIKISSILELGNRKYTKITECKRVQTEIEKKDSLKSITISKLKEKYVNITSPLQKLKLKKHYTDDEYNEFIVNLENLEAENAVEKLFLLNEMNKMIIEFFDERIINFKKEGSLDKRELREKVMKTIGETLGITELKEINYKLDLSLEEELINVEKNLQRYRDENINENNIKDLVDIIVAFYRYFHQKMLSVLSDIRVNYERESRRMSEAVWVNKCKQEYESKTSDYRIKVMEMVLSFENKLFEILFQKNGELKVLNMSVEKIVRDKKPVELKKETIFKEVIIPVRVITDHRELANLLVDAFYSAREDDFSKLIQYLKIILMSDEELLLRMNTKKQITTILKEVDDILKYKNKKYVEYFQDGKELEEEFFDYVQKCGEISGYEFKEEYF